MKLCIQIAVMPGVTDMVSEKLGASSCGVLENEWHTLQMTLPVKDIKQPGDLPAPNPKAHFLIVSEEMTTFSSFFAPCSRCQRLS